MTKRALVALSLVALVACGKPDVVVLELSSVDYALDPFGDAGPAPEGINISGLSIGGVPSGHRVTIDVQRQTEEVAIARAKPWLDGQRLPPDRRLALTWPRNPGPDIEVLVLPVRPLIALRRSDIQSAVLTQGIAPSLEVRFTPDARRRVEEATRPLVGKPVAILIDGRVLWAPHIGTPFGSHGEEAEMLSFVRDESRGRRALAVLRGETPPSTGSGHP